VFDEDPLEGLVSEDGDVELSEQEIWKEMKRMLHVKERRRSADETSDEGSSFYGDDYLTDDDSSGGDGFPHHCSDPLYSSFLPTHFQVPYKHGCALQETLSPRYL